MKRNDENIALGCTYNRFAIAGNLNLYPKLQQRFAGFYAWSRRLHYAAR